MCRLAILEANPQKKASSIDAVELQINNESSFAVLGRFERLYGPGYSLVDAQVSLRHASGWHAAEAWIDHTQQRLDDVRRFREPTVADMRQILGWQDGFNVAPIESRSTSTRDRAAR